MDKGRGSGVRKEVTEKGNRNLTEAKSLPLLMSFEDKTYRTSRTKVKQFFRGRRMVK